MGKEKFMRTAPKLNIPKKFDSFHQMILENRILDNSDREHITLIEADNVCNRRRYESLLSLYVDELNHDIIEEGKHYYAVIIPVGQKARVYYLADEGKESLTVQPIEVEGAMAFIVFHELVHSAAVLLKEDVSQYLGKCVRNYQQSKARKQASLQDMVNLHRRKKW